MCGLLNSELESRNKPDSIGCIVVTVHQCQNGGLDCRGQRFVIAHLALH